MIVKVEQLVKRYGDLVALDHFNLAVQSGEVCGLLGPNGSGKTTAINCMLALLKYSMGTVELFGRPMRPDAYDIKRDIGIVMQNVAVFDELTVRENIDYFCGLYVTDRHQRQALVDEAIAFVGLEDFSRFLPKKLSGGLLRRLNIACGIAHKPRLLILDEPTVAVDPQSRNSILEGIQELNRQGTTVLYTSHYMEEVEQICTMITIMDKGKGILTGTREELTAAVKLGDQVSLRLLNHTEEDLEAIRSLPFINRADLMEDRLVLTIQRGESRLASLIHTLENRNIAVAELNVRQPSLNDVFLEITGKELRDHVS